jgi:hypothetical protein
MPRFAVEGGRLRLVESPYAEPAEIYADSGRKPSRRLLDHLERWDRFYFPAEFAEPGPLGRLALHKIGLRAWTTLARRRLLYQRLEPGSEGVELTRAIFQAMADDVARAGARFVVVFLPSDRDLDMLAAGGGYRGNWAALVAAVREGGTPCLDLADGMLARREQLDAGYDGTHYGPRANRSVAELVREELERLGLW